MLMTQMPRCRGSSCDITLLASGCFEGSLHQQTHEMWSDDQILVRTTLYAIHLSGRIYGRMHNNSLYLLYSVLSRVADDCARSKGAKKIQSAAQLFQEIWKALGMQGIGEQVLNNFCCSFCHPRHHMDLTDQSYVVRCIS